MTRSDALIDRYVYATTRAVPETQREDLARELRAEIAEMVAARTDAGAPADAAERATLEELGDPERLAASYADRPLHLIGPAYFLVWKRLLTILLLWVPAILAIITTGSQLLDGEDVGKAVGDGVSTAIEIAVQVAFWTTLTFALIDRYASPSDAPEWSLSELPELPAKSHLTLAETAGTVATSVVTVALLVWQEVRGVIETDGGQRVPLIDSDLWSTWLPFLIALLVAEAVIAVVDYRRGRWTWPLAAGGIVVDVAFAIPVIWLLLDDQFLDPAFVAEVSWLTEGDHLHTVSLITAGIIALITASDIAQKLRAVWGQGDRARDGADAAVTSGS